MSPTQALAFLWYGRWWILAVTLICAVGGVIYAESRGTIWQAKSILYVERNAPVVPGNANVPSRNYASTQAAMLRSLPILQAALAQAESQQNPVFGDAEDQIAWLKRHLSVTVGEQDELITISLSSRFVQEACQMVNAIVDAYLRFHAKARNETASEILGHLTLELTRREAELVAVQQEQMDFLRKHPGVGLYAEASTTATERFRDLNTALTKAEAEMLESDANRQSAQSLPEPANLLALRQQRMELLAQVTKEHPAVAVLDHTITDLEKRATGNFEQSYQSAKQKYERLIEKVRDQEQKILAEFPTQAEYRILQMRVERARNIADALSERVRAISINVMELNAVIYERATTAGAVVSSSKAAIAVIVAFLGLLLGAGLAWVRFLVDQRLRSVEDVATLLPVAATVPKVATRKHGALQIWRKSPPFAEAMRSLRAVLDCTASRASGRTLQITSPEGRHGKSLVTAGLAIAMAQSGQRTLIVDTDFARASQARLFRLTPELGLAHVLAERTPVEDAIVATDIADLHVLPAGVLTKGAGALLDSAHLATVLRYLAGSYACILVDSPSLWPTADARVLAKLCDESLIVLRRGKSTRKQVHAACGWIAAVGGHVAGAILNWAPRGDASSLGTTRLAPRSSAIDASSEPVVLVDDFDTPSDTEAKAASIKGNQPRAFG